MLLFLSGRFSKITADAVQLDSLMVVPFVAIPLFVVLLVWWFVDSKRKKISHDELVAMLDKPESDDNVETGVMPSVFA